ncbi:hypothetical protein Btru_027319 [Bulinus truncatus]|nr:hypothetical protein Btru_027319 [Bulinus truncatus]
MSYLASFQCLLVGNEIYLENQTVCVEKLLSCDLNDSSTPGNISCTTTSPLATSSVAMTTLSGLMSTDLQRLLNLINFIIIQSVILVAGIVANGICIYAFIKIGVSDTVTVSFFALSLSDMCCLLIAVYNWLCYTMYRSPITWSVDMFSLMYLGVWYFQGFYDISMLVTTYTAVQKCCCIALPLHFKSVFTVRRTCAILVCFVLLCGAAYAPVLATQGLQSVTIPTSNVTYYTIWFSVDREEIIGINDIIIRVILQNTCEFIVLSCLFILTNSLRRQLQFRRSISMQHFSDASSEGSQTVFSNAKNSNGKSSKVNKVSAKELQVIKSVTMLSTLFVLCNLPRIVLSIARVIVPELDTYRRYHNIHLSLQMIRRVIEVSGSSANFLIYCKFNNKFRDVVVSLFRCTERVKT